MTTRLLLIRHGEPELTQALLGKTDSPLSPLGYQQLTACFEYIGSFDQLISSPLSRCKNFALDLSEQLNCDIGIEPQLREYDFGDWDGKTFQELQQTQTEAIAAFFADPANNTPPNGETLQQFSQRVETAALTLLEAYSEKKIVVLCHAGVIRTLVAWCLGMEYLSGHQFHRFAIDYASITELQVFQQPESPPTPQLLRLNHRVSPHHVN